MAIIVKCDPCGNRDVGWLWSVTDDDLRRDRSGVLSAEHVGRGLLWWGGPETSFVPPARSRPRVQLWSGIIPGPIPTPQSVDPWSAAWRTPDEHRAEQEQEIAAARSRGRRYRASDMTRLWAQGSKLTGQCPEHGLVATEVDVSTLDPRRTLTIRARPEHSG